MKEGLDWIARGIANIATDIRHHVVEEPWFGRIVTPELPMTSISPTEPRSNDHSFEWWAKAPATSEPDTASQEQDHDPIHHHR